MIQLFKSREKEVAKGYTEFDVQMEIMNRARVNAQNRKILAEKQKKTKVVSIGNAMTVLDQVLDKVGSYENSKITALTELYLALESGDTKNLIEFLKKGEVVKVKATKTKKSSWNSK
jgi:hypothetical protein